MLMGLILVIMNYISTVNRNKLVSCASPQGAGHDHLVVTAALSAKRNDQDQNAQLGQVHSSYKFISV